MDERLDEMLQCRCGPAFRCRCYQTEESRPYTHRQFLSQSLVRGLDGTGVIAHQRIKLALPASTSPFRAIELITSGPNARP